VIRSVRDLFFVASLATAFCASFAAAPARAADDPVVRVATLPIDPTAEIFYAQELGFFKKAGISVEVSTFTNGGASAAALVGGAVDIGLADLVSMASAHSRGLPLTYLVPGAVYTKDAQTYFLIVRKASTIKTAKDLHGKTIAVNGIKNINQIPTEAWIDNNGGDAKSVKFVEMPYPSMVPALDAARVDAAAVTEPTLALTQGKYRVLSLSDKNVAPSFLVAGYATTSDFAQKHPELVKKFVTAMVETAKWANTHRPQSAAILAKVSKLTPDVTDRMVRAYYGERLDAAQIQPVIDAAVKYGVIGKSFPASEIIAADGAR